jgi:hypothetical protein
MSDNPLRAAIGNLERKIVLLISNNQKVKEELKVAMAENSSLKEQLSNKDGEISNFQNQNKISKIVNGMVVRSDSEATELGDMLNEYIKEVDKCIAQLSE